MILKQGVNCDIDVCVDWTSTEFWCRRTLRTVSAKPGPPHTLDVRGWCADCLFESVDRCEYLMKIGLSLSRCVRDIVEGRVAVEDVLVLITRTDFDPTDQKQWNSIWNGYTDFRNEWTCLDHDRVFSVVLELWETGRIHQPRKFGAHPRRLSYYWLETVLPDSELQDRPAVKDAWDHFQVLAGLTNVKVDRNYG